MGSITRKMQALFLLAILLLPSEAEAEEIIGGVKAKPHSRPYMAYLTITRNNYAYSCGGFLISEQFVLTAAHCKGWNITVTLGAHDLTEEESTWQMLQVTQQIVHPNYDPNIHLNDIMLLKLQSRVRLTHAVSTVALPAASTFVQPGRICWAAGWGKTGVMEPTSDVLREVKLRIMDKNACDHFKDYNNHLQLCVGNPRKIRSAYRGDSGGPLLCAGVAQGIVSYGRSDAQPPAVFTRISPYVPWINEVLNYKQLRGHASLRVLKPELSLGSSLFP